jgi:hypothetical protein
MTWIGGLFSKVNMSQGELRKKLALIMETACPANEPSAVAYPPCIRFILDDMHGQALVKISLPVEGTPPRTCSYRRKDGQFCQVWLSLHREKTLASAATCAALFACASIQERLA